MTLIIRLKLSRNSLTTAKIYYLVFTVCKVDNVVVVFFSCGKMKLLCGLKIIIAQGNPLDLFFPEINDFSFHKMVKGQPKRAHYSIIKEINI